MSYERKNLSSLSQQELIDNYQLANERFKKLSEKGGVTSDLDKSERILLNSLIPLYHAEMERRGLATP